MDKNSKDFYVDAFYKCLKRNKLKSTPQRLAVHLAMVDLVHASVDMVYEHIVEQGKAKVTVASVYNILSQLSEVGLYTRRMSASNRMYFDISTAKHIHLYDISSDTFVDVFRPSLYEEIEKLLLKKRFKGYKIDGIDIQIICHPTSGK